MYLNTQTELQNSITMSEKNFRIFWIGFAGAIVVSILLGALEFCLQAYRYNTRDMLLDLQNKTQMLLQKNTDQPHVNIDAEYQAFKALSIKLSQSTRLTWFPIQEREVWVQKMVEFDNRWHAFDSERTQLGQAKPQWIALETHMSALQKGLQTLVAVVEQAPEALTEGTPANVLVKQLKNVSQGIKNTLMYSAQQNNIIPDLVKNLQKIIEQTKALQLRGSNIDELSAAMLAVQEGADFLAANQAMILSLAKSLQNLFFLHQNMMESLMVLIAQYPESFPSSDFLISVLLLSCVLSMVLFSVLTVQQRRIRGMRAEWLDRLGEDQRRGMRRLIEELKKISQGRLEHTLVVNDSSTSALVEAMNTSLSAVRLPLQQLMQVLSPCTEHVYNLRLQLDNLRQLLDFCYTKMVVLQKWDVSLPADVSGNMDAVMSVYKKQQQVLGGVHQTIGQFGLHKTLVLQQIAEGLQQVHTYDAQMQALQNHSFGLHQVLEKVRITVLNTAIQATLLESQGKGVSILLEELQKMVIDLEFLDRQIQMGLQNLQGSSKNFMSVVMQVEQKIEQEKQWAEKLQKQLEETGKLMHQSSQWLEKNHKTLLNIEQVNQNHHKLIQEEAVNLERALQQSKESLQKLGAFSQILVQITQIVEPVRPWQAQEEVWKKPPN